MSSFKVIYFPARGRAEATRLALAFNGVAFEDVRLPGAALFGEYKSKAPFGQFPLLEVDGKILAQSGSQLRFVARNTGGGKLYPADAFEAAVAESVADQINDVAGAVYQVMYATPEGAARDAAKATLMSERLPKLLAGVISGLGDKPFFGGAAPCFADFAAFALLESAPRFGIDVAAMAPTLGAHLERVRALPELAAYFARRAEVEAAEEAAAKAAAGSA